MSNDRLDFAALVANRLTKSAGPVTTLREFRRLCGLRFGLTRQDSKRLLKELVARGFVLLTQDAIVFLEQRGALA